ncbi:1670_t:CDS:2, partial [Acaulospora colombiana]
DYYFVHFCIERNQVPRLSLEFRLSIRYFRLGAYKGDHVSYETKLDTSHPKNSCIPIDFPLPLDGPSSENDKIQLFRFIGSIPRWEGYVLLFIVVSNIEYKRADANLELFLDEWNNIRQEVQSLYGGGGASPFQYAHCVKIMESYKAYREDDKVDEIGLLIESMSNDLKYHSITSLPNLIDHLKNLTSFQRQLLRSMCISRVRSFSEYAIYVSRWKDKSNAEKIAHYEKQEKEKIEILEFKNQQQIDEIEALRADKEEQGRKLDSLESENKELTNEIKTLKANKEKAEQALKEKIELEKKILECISAKDRDAIKKHNTFQSERPHNKKFNGKQEVASAFHKEGERLKLEVAKCHAVWGCVANLEWCDEDPTNPAQLTREIEKLQRDLANLTMIKGKEVKIHQDAVSELFERYKCKTSTSDKTMKCVLSAVLQRHTLELIIQHSEKYLNCSNGLNGIMDIPEERLELGVKSRVNDLCNLMKRFCESTSGGDELSRVPPIRLRQQVYAILSNRVFASQNHPFIQEIVRDLLTSMDKFRTIESKERKEKFNSKAASLVQQVINIFCFRLNTQEPVPAFKFYESGRQIDARVMEGVWNGSPENFEIEVCAFPVVTVMKEDGDERILTKARVLVR